MDFPKYDFGTLRYRHHEGEGVYTESYAGVNETAFELGLEHFISHGFKLRESYSLGPLTYRAMSQGDSAVFLSYFKEGGILFCVTEPVCNYFSFTDTPRRASVPTSITQLDLKDFGLSYVIRLSDGRLIVIDGGCIFEEDADNLLLRMKELSGDGDIVIAAWIMTHPHLDHYRCFITFMEKYAELVTVERFIYNFPDADEKEYETHPELAHHDEILFLTRFYDLVKKTGAPVYRAHTGQVYRLGNATLEMLGSPDDNECVPVMNSNCVSLVFKMTAEGQTVLFTGDRQLQHSLLVSLWDKYLKCDILQIPHHGFHGGTVRLYDLADARVYLAPTFHDDCYEKILPKYDFNLHCWFDLDPDDYITGSFGDVTIELPYTPAPERKLEIGKYLREYNVKREPTVITDIL
ncbi:MAG: MBL fold metallo-hydrolase [Clostridia bacterium]|nr:MBL fold metallo-hydrolase [Clostridia bacterium]